MFIQSKQLAVVLVISTALTSVGLALLISALTCVCEHDAESGQAVDRAFKPDEVRLASAEPLGQLPPDVIVLELEKNDVSNRIERIRSRGNLQRRNSMRTHRDISDPFSPGYWDLMLPSEEALAAEPRKKASARRTVRKAEPISRARRKQEITDPWAD